MFIIIHLLNKKYHRFTAKLNLGEKNLEKCIHESVQRKESGRGTGFRLFGFSDELSWLRRVEGGSLSDGRPPCSESNYDDGDDEDDDD